MTPTSHPLASVNSDGTSFVFLHNVPTIVVFLAKRSSSAFCFYAAMNICAATVSIVIKGLEKRSLFRTKKKTIEMRLVSKCAE
ncbi:hypothetical protein T07_8859 [Trichinella nelsoni]|uniref:Uncharacterized protein n=1 Tax=Trichinella nelsoni TaxID=6336 RepID=A0A0V0REV9_9BILA|nr:hypothetical protein T07_8859 [Trichinella nelsoni]